MEGGVKGGCQGGYFGHPPPMQYIYFCRAAVVAVYLQYLQYLYHLHQYYGKSDDANVL